MSDYLPPELVSKILISLPVDALLRCRSVCKSWYSLIASSSFIYEHLKLSLNNENRLFKIYYEYGEIKGLRFSVHLDNQTLEQVAESYDCPSTIEKMNLAYNYMYGCFRIIGNNVNGLLCLYHDGDERIVLWNPSIRKTLTLPSYIPDSDYWHQCLGFGFVPKTDNFKIVRIVYLSADDLYSPPKPQPKVEVVVYELSTGSWRKINDPDLRYYISYGYSFVNGIVHWCGQRYVSRCTSSSDWIVTFDMTSEKFGELMIPSTLEFHFGSALSVYTVRESLCLVQSSGYIFNMWIMKEYGVAESWTMQVKIDVHEKCIGSNPFYFRGDGNIIFHHRLRESLVSYDPTTQELTDISGWGKKTAVSAYNYTESLFLLK